MSPVKRDIRRAGDGAAGVDADGRAGAVRDEPEIIAAEGIHVGIDDGDGRRRRDHRLDRVAALAEHAKPGLGRQMVGGDDHPPHGPGRLQHGTDLGDPAPDHRRLAPDFA